MQNIFLIPPLHLPPINRLTVIVINFIAVALVIVVFNSSRFRDVQSKIFVAMSVFMLLWVDFAYLARFVGESQLVQSEFYIRIAWVATPLFFYSVYLTTEYVLERQKRNKVIRVLLLLAAVLLSVATAFTNFVIKGTKFTGVNFDIDYGSMFYPFLGVIFVLMISTLIPLFRTKLNKKTRAFLYGVLIFYFANLIFNIALPVFFNITYLYYIGDYSTVFILGLTVYAIVQHNLFDVKVVATELLTVVVWIVLFAKLFVSQSQNEFTTDLVIFVLITIFGILLVRSVAREIKQRQKLEELTTKLRELDKQKDEFISVVAHELRSPLTAIKGYISMVVEGDGGTIEDKARSYLSDANAVNERLIRLVNNMLNVTRIEEGRIVYQIEKVDLIKAIQEIYYSFKFEAQRKGLEFNLDVSHGVIDKVEVDPDRIREVIGNYVSNAIKFTDTGKVIIKISNSTKSTIKVEVIDTGPGITKEEQVKLFNKFYRASSTEGKTIGTGLGLYISKLLVDKFGGKVGLNSEFGKGSNFWFQLPLTKV
jgi:signal transduction histidine kinase